MPIKIKRIYDESNDNDGYRILIDRLWPRGISKDSAKIDEWNKDIAPSNELRKFFSHKAELFPEFKARYKKELESKSSELLRLKNISEKSNLTLLYAAKDSEYNQAVVLLEQIEQI